MTPPMSQDPLFEMTGIASVYRKRGMYELAETLYRKVLAASPESKQGAIALYGLGELYSDQGRYPEATDYFKRAVAIWETLHPVDARSMLWYMDALTKLQDAVERNAKLGELLQLDEESA